jgi:SAM-dependent methyltransferase
VSVRFHAAGKVVLEHIYASPDPRAYFGTLRGLGYRIPELAKPHFARLIDEYRRTTGVRTTTVVDVGCSYGINAALLRYDLTIDELYAHYCNADPGASREDMLAADRALVRGRRRSWHTRFVGLDIAPDALSYGLAAGFLDDVVHADLERDDPTPGQCEQLARADIVVSTGCIGYVGERTLARVVAACGGRRPWMAHTVLRMYPFAPIAECLARLGYETVAASGLIRQRRFASPEEQAGVLDTLDELGVDPSGVETDGWLYARLFLSRPRPMA